MKNINLSIQAPSLQVSRRKLFQSNQPKKGAQIMAQPQMTTETTESNNVVLLDKTAWKAMISSGAVQDAKTWAAWGMVQNRGSEIRGSEIRGSEIRGSEIRGSEIRGSEIRGSEIRGSEIRDQRSEVRGRTTDARTDKQTPNIQRRTPNVEWRKSVKQKTKNEELTAD